MWWVDAREVQMQMFLIRCQMRNPTAAYLKVGYISGGHFSHLRLGRKRINAFTSVFLHFFLVRPELEVQQKIEVGWIYNSGSSCKELKMILV